MIELIAFILYTLLLFFMGKRLGAKAPDCIHHFETVEVRRVADGNSEDGYDYYQRYIIRCTKCGEMRKRDMK